MQRAIPNSKMGMCFAIEIDENVSNKMFEKTGETPKVDVAMWFEARDGVTPSASGWHNG